MTRIPILLIELLDSAGATAEDARARAAVLRAAGFAPRALAIAPPGRGALLDPPAEGTIPHREAAAAVRETLAARPVERVVVASGSHGAEGGARWLPAGARAVWWPTALEAPSPVRRLPWLATRGLPPIDEAERAGANGRDPTHARAALEWALLDERASARRLRPLWDGDYVLAPAPFAGPEAEATLAGFALAARAQPSLDLIVLTDPRRELERRARSLGVAPRVHFAGDATREAERAWLLFATAALFAGPGPISAGLALRAFASGCPVAGVGAGGVGPALEGWLEERGGERMPSGAGAEEIAALLASEERLRRRAEQGRAVAATRRAEALVPRLASALGAPRPLGRQAA